MSNIKQVNIPKDLLKLKDDTIRAIMEILYSSIPGKLEDSEEGEISVNWMHNVLMQCVVSYTFRYIPQGMEEEFLDDFGDCIKLMYRECVKKE